MRLLQLVTAPGELLDLHPHITIVQALDHELRERLIDTVVGLAGGRAVGEGLLEAHGVLFPLDQTHLDELELHELAIDPIVRRADLPGQHGAVDAGELASQQAVFAGLLERISQRADEQSRARDELAAAVAALERARTELEAAKAGSGDDDEAGGTGATGDADARRVAIEERLLDEWAEHEGAIAARAALETQIAQLQEAVDVAAARTLRAEEALERLDEPGAGDGSGTDEPVEDERAADLAPDTTDRLAELDQRVAAIDNRIAALAHGDPSRLDEALGLLRAGASMVPSAAARSLADEIEALDRQIGDQAVAEASAAAIAHARTRLDAARQSLLEAEQAARSPVLSRADVEELEQAHDALQDAIERSDGRFSGGRAQRRVDERRMAEQAVLDRLGFRSYADYVMGSSTRQADPTLDQALTAARAELQAAEDEWRALGAQVDEELERAELLDRRRAMSDQARSLLGRLVDRPDEAAALRDLRVPAVATADAISAVRSALDAAGIDLAGEELDVEELTALTESAVAAAREGEARRLDLIEERAALEHERRIPDALTSADRELLPDPPRPDPLRPAASSARRIELDAELASARDLEQAAVEARDAVRAELDAAIAAESALADLVRGSEAELAAVVDQPPAAVETDDRLSELASAVDAAERAHERALQRVEAEDRELAVLDEEGRSLAAQIERQEELVVAHEEGATTTSDELEWYLLARIAAQRSVSVAGSLPLVLLDDALGLVGPDEARRLLDRLERMADAVQVIVVSDAPELVAWTEAVGPARAAAVRVTAA